MPRHNASVIAPGIPGVTPTCCPGTPLRTEGEAGVRCCGCGSVWRFSKFGTWDLLSGPYVLRERLY